MDPTVVHVELEPGDHGEFEVRWDLVGDPCAVDVAYGATPVTIDHRHQFTVDVGVTFATLSASGDGPHYVSVAPHGAGPAVIAGERRVRFAGLQNFRDLGGYRTASGGRTRWGVLFRADSLHKLTAADLRVFERLGMHWVFDLRGDQELATHPNRVPATQLAVVGRPRTDGAVDDAAVRADWAASGDGERILRDLYVGMLVHSGPLFGRLIATLAEPGGVPAVFHCHAGKDRTGIVAALVLLAVGVDRETVLDDYELTRQYRKFEHQQDSFTNMIDRGLSPEVAAGVLSTPRWAMSDAIDALDSDHGGIEQYLTTEAGLSTAQLDALRNTLVS